jgi:WD40 repeat protein
MALPGDSEPEDRSIAIDDAHTVLAVEIREGDQASILLCPLAGSPQEWTCSTSGGAAIERIGLGIDLKPNGCGNDTHLAIAVSRSGRLISAGAGSCPIQVFDRQNPGAPPKAFTFAEDFKLASLDFSPDEKGLVGTSSRNPQVRVWNLSDGSWRNINHHFSPVVTAARYSTSGKWIISASYDNTVVVADANTGEKLVALSYRNSLLSLDIASTKKGTLMATGSESGDVNVMRFFEDETEVTSFAASVLQDISQ